MDDGFDVDGAFSDVLAGLDGMQAKFNEGFDAMRAGVVNASRRREVAGPPVAGYAAWYDASDAASITSSGGAVSQWSDKSGNGNHAVQTAGSNKPTTGTRTQNGLNVLDFDAGDWVSASGLNLSHPSTIFAVALPDVVNDTFHSLFDGDSSSEWGAYYGSGIAWRMVAATLGNTAHAATVAAAQFSFVFNGASSKFFKDATQYGGSFDTGSATSTGVTIGQNRSPFRSGGWNGWIAEFIVYASALSDANRQTVEAYLKAKWATP